MDILGSLERYDFGFVMSSIAVSGFNINENDQS